MMKKEDIINELNSRLNRNNVSVTKKDTSIILEEFTNLIKRSIIQEKEEVQIPRLGTFSLYRNKSKYKRNPVSGKQDVTFSREIPSFRTSKKFRDELRDQTITFEDPE